MALTIAEARLVRDHLSNTFNKAADFNGVSYGLTSACGVEDGYAVAVRAPRDLKAAQIELIRDRAVDVIGRRLDADEIEFRNTGVIRP